MWPPLRSSGHDEYRSALTTSPTQRSPLTHEGPLQRVVDWLFRPRGVPEVQPLYVHAGQSGSRFSKRLLPAAVTVVFALGAATCGHAQEPAESAERLVETESAVEGEPRRISDWALAGVVWSDAHLVRKLARVTAEQSDDPERTAQMQSLVEDTDRIIDALQQFGWQQLQARRAVADEEASDPAVSPAAPKAVAEAEANPPAPEEVVVRRQPVPDAPSEEAALARRVESESPPGLNDPGVDDELLPHAFDFDLNRYRVDDYIDEVPSEDRSIADAVEDGAEGALAAGVDNVSGVYGVGRADSRISRREASTRSNTLPYSEDSIYDTDDFDPDVDYDVERPLTEPVPSDSNPLVEQVPDADLEDRPVPTVTPEAVPAETPDVDSEDDLVKGLAAEDEVPAEEGDVAAEPVAPQLAPTDLRRFTGLSERFEQDAAWVQFRLDANQRTWRMLESQPSKEALRRYLDAAIAQLQAHAQLGHRLTDDARLAAILHVVGGDQ